jgi:hypothetical protein
LRGSERETAAELEARRQAVERRCEQLDLRQVALDRKLEEVRRLHCETLEARLATEELWGQLADLAPAATLTRSLGRIRAQLSDQYRLAHADLAERKQELEALAARLVEHLQRIVKQKQDVQEWVDCRQAELERQAEELVGREQELVRQETELDRMKHRWLDSRLAHQAGPCRTPHAWPAEHAAPA